MNKKILTAIIAMVISSAIVVATIPAISLGATQMTGSDSSPAEATVDVTASITETIEASIPNAMTFGSGLQRGNTVSSTDNGGSWDLVIHDTTTVGTDVFAKIQSDAEGTLTENHPGMYHDQGDTYQDSGTVNWRDITMDPFDNNNEDNIASTTMVKVLSNLPVPSVGTDDIYSLYPEINIPNDAPAGTYSGKATIAVQYVGGSTY